MDKYNKSTWNGKNITGKAMKIWELNTPLVPPLDGIAPMEIFLRKTPELGQFINSSMPPLEPCSEILLGRTVGIGFGRH